MDEDIRSMTYASDGESYKSLWFGIVTGNLQCGLSFLAIDGYSRSSGGVETS